jgi:hypothetical protein
MPAPLTDCRELPRPLPAFAAFELHANRRRRGPGNFDPLWRLVSGKI